MNRRGERTWQLHAACNFSLNATPGLPLEDVLAALRARLVAQPGLISSDWTAPLAQLSERPRMALVPPATSKKLGGAKKLTPRRGPSAFASVLDEGCKALLWAGGRVGG